MPCVDARGVEQILDHSIEARYLSSHEGKRATKAGLRRQRLIRIDERGGHLKRRERVPQIVRDTGEVREPRLLLSRESLSHGVELLRHATQLRSSARCCAHREITAAEANHRIGQRQHRTYDESSCPEDDQNERCPHEQRGRGADDVAQPVQTRRTFERLVGTRSTGFCDGVERVDCGIERGCPGDRG